MEAILFGLLMTILGFSMFFAKDFWWGIQDSTNQMRGLVSKRTDMWEIGMNFSGLITVLAGFIFMYFGVQGHGFRSQPVIPAICSELDSNSSAKSSAKDKVQDAVKIGCAAAQKKEYRTAVIKFKEALSIKNRIDNSQNIQIVEPTDFDLLYAIAQMERQSK